MAKMTNDAQTRTWELWTSYALLGHRRLKTTAAAQVRLRQITPKKRAPARSLVGSSKPEVGSAGSDSVWSATTRQIVGCQRCSRKLRHAAPISPLKLEPVLQQASHPPLPLSCGLTSRASHGRPVLLSSLSNAGHNSSNSESDNSNIRGARNRRRGPAVRLSASAWDAEKSPKAEPHLYAASSKKLTSRSSTARQVTGTGSGTGRFVAHQSSQASPRSHLAAQSTQISASSSSQ
jgi:hypothetical protein